MKVIKIRRHFLESLIRSRILTLVTGDWSYTMLLRVWDSSSLPFLLFAFVQPRVSSVQLPGKTEIAWTLSQRNNRIWISRDSKTGLPEKVICRGSQAYGCRGSKLPRVPGLWREGRMRKVQEKGKKKGKFPWGRVPEKLFSHQKNLSDSHSHANYLPTHHLVLKRAHDSFTSLAFSSSRNFLSISSFARLSSSRIFSSSSSNCLI